ncbi:hypothetical protein PVAND_016867 [Polypedilum vanderplanki]|uniref:IGFBP N-terminal domain-containing protein n=1 Tax=Polypedilum vanderplanki TaxID=319348 RepID=A0A9J6BGE9_POLVA|nr:hypothetical protein PVAND_016867 [Polypedilum vanderplanki]
MTRQKIVMKLLIIFTNISVLYALKCVCNVNDCDLIKAEDCPGRGLLIWDPCRCCKVCAKTVGETCGGLGGFSGTCEPPLKCISKPPIIGTGICLELPSNINNNTISSSRKDKKKSQKSKQQRCQERIKIQPGCEIVERRCQCWPEAISVCRESSLVKWDFINIEECELNLANLVKSEVEFDEDYTMPPTSYAEIAVVESSLSVAKLLVNQTAARLQSANATLANLKTPIKPLFLVWQLIVNLHANILKINQARMVALQAKLDALKAQQASAGCVSTTTTTTTTSTTTPTTTTTTTPTTTTSTTTTTTTTASPYPCGTLIKYDPKTDPKKPETDGFSAGKWADGDAYVGTGITPRNYTYPAMILTTNSFLGPGAYVYGFYDDNTPSYLLKNPNLKWIPITDPKTFDSVNGKIFVQRGSFKTYFGRTQLTEGYTSVGLIYSGSFYYPDISGTYYANNTGFDVLVCSDSTSSVNANIITTASTASSVVTTTSASTTTSTTMATTSPTTSSSTTISTSTTATTTSSTTSVASPSTCNACGILKTCIIGSPSTCTCPSTKTKNPCAVLALGFCCL